MATPKSESAGGCAWLARSIVNLSCGGSNCRSEIQKEYGDHAQTEKGSKPATGLAEQAAASWPVQNLRRPVRDQSQNRQAEDLLPKTQRAFEPPSARGEIIAMMPVSKEIMARAHRIVNHALIDGLIVRKPCCICRYSPADAHHEDYRQPLNVVWLCEVHHLRLHYCPDRMMQGQTIRKGQPMTRSQRKRAWDIARSLRSG